MSANSASKSAKWSPNQLVWIKEGSTFYKAIVRKYADEKDVKKLKNDGVELGYVLLYYPNQEGVTAQGGMQAWVPDDQKVSVHYVMFPIIVVYFLYLVGSGASQAWRNPTRHDEDSRLILRRGGGAEINGRPRQMHVAGLRFSPACH